MTVAVDGRHTNPPNHPYYTMSVQASAAEISPREYHPVKPLHPEETSASSSASRTEGTCRNTSPLSWTATGAGPSSAICPRPKGIVLAASPCATLSAPAANCKLRWLTLYTFSTENWSRPEAEVEELMQWLHEALCDEVSELHENNVSLNAIGRTDELSPTIQLALEHALAQTKDKHRPQAQLGAQLRGP